ncbi:MAG: M28 family peptidase [Dehalococcoidia bacterium]
MTGKFARGAVLVLIMVGAIAIARDQFHTPSPKPISTPATAFSADRAMQHVEALAVAPRPQGSVAAEAARDYIVRAIEALGLTPELQTTTVVRTAEGADAIFASTVVNVLARIPGTDSSGAILVNAHYDSGPNALGAGDCGSCVGAVLEAIRALLAGPPLRNDVIVLFSDGEETQLFGAYAFMQQHPWATEVAFALNLESQGVTGPAVFYVSGKNDADVAAKVIGYAPQPAAWSFVTTLVRALVGGSDLDGFTDEGIPGAGVAFFESEQYYHTRLDSPDRLSRGSLQHLGDYTLGIMRGLGDDDLTMLDASGDGIYFTLWRGTVVRYPAGFALAFALLSTLAICGLLYVGRRRRALALGRVAAAAGLFVAVLLVTVLLTSVLWQLVRITNADYQVLLIGVTYEADTFVLLFVLLAVSLLLGTHLWISRHLRPLELAAGALGVWWLATVLTALLLPTFSALFTWPLLAGLAVTAFALLRPTKAALPWAGVASFSIVALPTLLLMLPAVVLFQTLAGRIEALAGVPAMGFPILMAALATGLLLPFLPVSRFRHPWRLPLAMAVIAVVLIAWTSASSSFDTEHPKPNMLMYQLDADTGSAEWLTTAGGGLGFGRSGQRDDWTSQVFAQDAAEADIAGWSAYPDMSTPGYRTEAPLADLEAPTLNVVADHVSGDTRTLHVRVASPRGAPNVRLFIDAPVIAVSTDGTDVNVGELDLASGLWMTYLALPMEGVEIALRVDSPEPFEIEVHDWSQGLPDFRGLTIRPRPDGMMPSAHDLADTTMVRRTYVID